MLMTLKKSAEDVKVDQKSTERATKTSTARASTACTVWQQKATPCTGSALTYRRIADCVTYAYANTCLTCCFG